MDDHFFERLGAGGGLGSLTQVRTVSARRYRKAGGKYDGPMSKATMGLPAAGICGANGTAP
jgi:hypothetical protein